MLLFSERCGLIFYGNSSYIGLRLIGLIIFFFNRFAVGGNSIRTWTRRLGHSHGNEERDFIKSTRSFSSHGPTRGLGRCNA